MEQFILTIINDFGYAGIALLIFVENLFPPIPSEVILLFGGFLTTCSRLTVGYMIAAATAGSYAGACVLYSLGSLLGKERLRALIAGKVGRALHLKQAHVDKAFSFLERYQKKAVLIGRCIPIVRSIISIPAGMTKMSFPLFSALTVIGSAVWNTIVILLGHFIGSAWHNYLVYFNWYAELAVIAIVFIAVIAVLRYLKKRRSSPALQYRAKHTVMTPGRMISAGFAAIILLGSILLYLPFTQKPGIDVSFTDALFTATSAVCVTGLISIDTADHFNRIGQTVVALLIQLGGLGITSIGVGLMILSGRKINMRERYLVKEALNYNSFQGVLGLVQSVLVVTIAFELAGAALSFLVFSRDYPTGDALFISLFHSIAAFNNSGFDVLGGYRNLIPYQNNVLLNLTTGGLIVFGGLGFFVIRELIKKRRFHKFSLHTKVVLVTTALLIVLGTALLKATENITWLGAFFTSISARTAGFSTFPIGEFTNPGLFVLVVLMFIGASPGSTGGGIKTTTFFILISTIVSCATNRDPGAFQRKFPRETVYKAFLIFSLSVLVVLLSVYALSIAEPGTEFMKLLFECVSAFGTVGLSTGITPNLTDFGKYVLIFTMYIGRIGPLTAASLLITKPSPSVSRAEEQINIG